MNFLRKHAYDVGCGFAACLWPFLVARRRLSVENLLRSGVAADERAAHCLAGRAFRHFFGHIFEALCVPGVVNASNWREHLDFSAADPEAVRLLLDSPDTPILRVSGHHGCWEAATNVLSFARPMIAIARVMDSRILRGWMKRFHFRGAVTIIDKNDGFKPSVLRQWQRECSAMTILMDQYSYGGALVRFFGRPARTVTSAARLGIRCAVPIVIGSFVRIAPFRYRLVGDAPIVLPKDISREAAVQMLNDRLEKAIRQYPEQYLWMHRRWRDD